MENLSRLHLGSGRHYWPGWINVDLVDSADVQSDVKKLDFSDNSIDEIQGIHIFEHLDRLEVDDVLAEWHRVLKPGGRLVMEMPSLDKMAKLICEGETNVRLTLLGIFGDPREKSPYMRHQWAWTDEELYQVLTNVGFTVEFQPPVFHLPRRDLRVIGRKA